MKHLLIAIHRITTSRPGAELEFTGRYSVDGDPILKKATYSIRPRSFFEWEEGPELLQLIEQGSARYPEEFELLAYEREQAPGA